MELRATGMRLLDLGMKPCRVTCLFLNPKFRTLDLEFLRYFVTLEHKIFLFANVSFTVKMVLMGMGAICGAKACFEEALERKVEQNSGEVTQLTATLNSCWWI